MRNNLVNVLNKWSFHQQPDWSNQLLMKSWCMWLADETSSPSSIGQLWYQSSPLEHDRESCSLTFVWDWTNICSRHRSFVIYYAAPSASVLLTASKGIILVSPYLHCWECHTSVSLCTCSVFIWSRINEMVWRRISPIWPFNIWIWSLAASNRACSHAFSSINFSRVWKKIKWHYKNHAESMNS